MKKFYAVIGNPPYQEEVEGNGRQSPIYNYFMDESYKVAERAELITPARFLFNAGQTPKKWNNKMLNDEHFKVLRYIQDASEIFPNTDIKGGVAITMHNASENYGGIKTFTAYNALNSITEKVVATQNGTDKFLDSIVSSRGTYRLTSKFFDDFPEAAKKLGAGTGNMMVSNILEKVPEAFLKLPPDNRSTDFYKILGRIGNKRVYRYINSEYLIDNEFISTYNVLLPKANGTGKLGEVLAKPLVAEPLSGATDTFISIGSFATEQEVAACLKYITLKFSRVLLGVLKVTQDNSKSVWRYVPLQDFTSDSDIDWSLTTADIDQQLYKKYGLNDEEIEFIETHVKAMD